MDCLPKRMSHAASETSHGSITKHPVVPVSMMRVWRRDRRRNFSNVEGCGLDVGGCMLTLYKMVYAYVFGRSATTNHCCVRPRFGGITTKTVDQS